MRRFGLPLALALLVTAAATADDKPDVKKIEDVDKGKFTIRWHGQSFFEITSSKGTKDFIDPHGLEQYRMNLKEEAYDADLVLISHPHSDHNNLTLFKGYKEEKEEKRPFKTIYGVDPMTKDWGKANNVQVKDVKVHVVGATFHDKVGGMDKGKNGVLVIEVDGMRIVHLGDLGHVLTEKQVERIKADKPIDILLVPIGGVYTLHGLDAMRVVEQLNPTRYTIPMHYGTIVYDWLLDLKKSHFLDDVDPKKVVELKTNKLVIDPMAPAPKEMKFTILHFFEN